jgi:hypothetical protein
MSYALRYWGEFGDYFDDIFRVEIYENYYGGASSEMIFQGDMPLELSYPGDEMDVFRPLYGSQLSMNIISETDFQYISLHTADARRFKVKLLKNSVLYWTGWILPDLFAEPYIAPPYPVKIVARCGIGEFETTPMPATVLSYIDGDPTPTQKSFVNLYSAFIHFFKALNLDLNIHEAINIYQADRPTAPVITDTTLTDTYVDLSEYQDKTVYDFIADQLKVFGARMYQQDGAWWVVRLKEYKATLKYRVLPITGSGTITYDDTKLTTFLVGKPVASYILASSPELKINPAWKSFKIIQKDELLGSILRNPLFTERENTTVNMGELVLNLQKPKYWLSNCFVYMTMDNLLNIESNTIPAWTNRIWQNVNLKEAPGQGLRIRFEILTYSTSNPLPASSKFAIMAYSSGSNGTFWAALDAPDTKLGNWSTDGNRIIVDNVRVNNSLDTTTSSYEVTIKGVPNDGDVEFSIYGAVGAHLLVKSFTVDIVKLVYPIVDSDLLTVSSVPIVKEFLTEREINVTINPNNAYIGPDLELIGGDLPDEPNATYIWRYGYRKVTREATNEWANLAAGDDKQLIEHLQEDYRSMYLLPQWVLRLPILSQGIKFDSSIVDYQIINKKYQCVSANLDLKSAIFNGTYAEIGAYEGGNWILETGYWDDNGIWIDSETWLDSPV